MNYQERIAWSTRHLAFFFGMLPPILVGNGQSHAEDDGSSNRQIKFTEVVNSSGIDFVHTTGGSGMEYIVEGMSAGVATFDYDNDGNIDIYFLNGSPLEGNDGPATSNRLYRNLGNWKFVDVTEEAGVGDTGYSLGVGVADYDGDGNLDLYVNNFGENKLYRNKGNRTFEDVTTQAGVGNGNKVGAGVGFFDMDGDNDLDLYVANYVDFNFENHVPIVIKGIRFQAGPQYYQPVPDTLYRNDGDGQFTDVSSRAGIGSIAGPGMGLICADFDGDSDCDVYVCNDGQPNFLFENDGTGLFSETGILSGLAYDFAGKANSSMGVDIGDFDRDGLPDLFVTNYQGEMPVLYRNLSGGLFEDATSTARIPNQLFPHVSWGTAFADFDHDRMEDLFVACGHFDRVEQIDDRTTKKLKNYVLRNTPDGFKDVAIQAGDGLNKIASSRGIACEDFDNDGDLDILIVDSGEPPSLIRNELNGGDWIQLEPRQAGMNRFAIGARVQISDGSQTRWLVSGRGYQSYWGTRLHFGVSNAPEKINIEITWPDGVQESFSTLKNSRSTLQRGTGAKITAD